MARPTQWERRLHACPCAGEWSPFEWMPQAAAPACMPCTSRTLLFCNSQELPVLLVLLVWKPVLSLWPQLGAWPPYRDNAVSTFQPQSCVSGLRWWGGAVQVPPVR